MNSLESLKRINNEKTLQSAIHTALSCTTALLSCDRATMFVVDEITDELVVKDASSTADIRIPVTAGIAGHVYCEGGVVNIPDAYKDPRFNKDTDAKTGYKTTSILCSPVYDAEGNTVAVIQAINKLGKEGVPHVPFTKEDETLVDYMAGQIGVILLNAKIYEDSLNAKKKVEAMLDIVRSLHSDMGVNSVSFTLTERTPQLVEADRCTLYLVDDKHQELWTISGNVEIRIPKSSGIAGEVATKGLIVNIPDAYKDPRFNQEFDKKSGFHTKTILCLPIKSTEKESEGKVVGVLQLINKKQGAFTSMDEELLERFLSIAAGIIEHSRLFEMTSPTRERKGTEFENNVVPTKVVTSKLQAMSTFEEGEEEEDDD